MAFITEEKNVIARKPHRCTWCGEPIAKGESYWKWKSVNGAWFTSKMHPECRERCQEDYCLYGDDDYFPYSNDRHD